MPHRGGRPLTRLLVAGLTAASVVTPWVGADATSTTPEPTWTGVGPANIADTLAAYAPTTAVSGLAASGEVGVVAFSPSGATVFAAGGGGMWWGPYSYAGVMRSLNGGQTWTRIDAGLTDPFVQSLWVDPTNPSTVLAGTSSAIFRSTDDGTTWSRVEPTGAQFLVASGDAVYAGGPTGVFSSSDAGASWRLDSTTSLPVTALAAAGGVIYAAQADGTVMTSDGGPFTVVRAGSGSFSSGIQIAGFAVDPATPTTVFAFACCNEGGFVSHDGGVTWSPLALAAVYSTVGAQTVTVDPTDPATVIVGGNEVYYTSHDGGSSFTPSPIPLDLRSWTPWPGRPGVYAVGSDQGLFSFDANTGAWQSLSGNVNNFLLQSVSVSGSTILTMAQDWNVIRSDDGGASWQLVLHGAGENGSVVIDPAAPLDAVAIGTARGLVVSSDGGLTWSQPSLPGTKDGSALFNAGGDVVTYTPSDPSTVYAATADGVFVSHDAGATWSKPPWPIAIPSLVVVDPTDPNTIIVGSRNVAGWMGYATSGSLFITHDGGTTWATVPLDGASGYPSSAAFDPVDSSIVLVSMSVGPGSGGGVLISRDGGTTFERDDTGLPSLDVNSPVAVISDVIGVAVGGTPIFATATAGGVFASTPTGPWVDVTGNLAPPVVADLAVANQELYAATYGAGVQATPLTTVLANATSAASTPTIPRPPAAGSITGLVVDGRGHPLGRACVIVSPSRRQTTTSAVGRFTIAHLTLGVYELTIDARGCRRSTPSPWPVRHRSDVHVRPDAATVVRVRL